MKKNLHSCVIIAGYLVLLIPSAAIAQSDNSGIGKALRNDSAGDYTGSIQVLNTVIQQQPKLPEAWLLRGKAKYQLKDYRGAICDLQRAAQLQPANEHTLLASGYARLALKQYRAAITDFSNAIAINPSNSITWYHRGLTKQKLRQPQQARLDFNRANELGLLQLKDRLLATEPE